MNPWRTLSSEVKYDNAWITVVEHEVLTPGGRPGIYGTVHFKHPAIGVVVLDDEMNTWLVGQFRFPLEGYSWEIPEGGGTIGEDPLDGAKQELREETGIEAARWEMIQEMDLSNSVSDERAYIFLARDLRFGDSAPEDTEQLTVRKMPFEEAYRMVEEGQIRDAMSVAGLTKVRLMLLEGRL